MGIALSESLPAGKTQSPATTPGKKMSGAPVGAPVRPTTLVPAALVNAITLSDPWKPLTTPTCDETVNEASETIALSLQLSEGPSCIFLTSTYIYDTTSL